MEFLWIMIGTSVIGFIIHLLTSAVVKAPGSILQGKFAHLTEDTNGVIAGKTYDEIVAVCGQPTSRSPIGDSQILCQWMETSYHIALIFDENNVCQGISHECKV